MHNRISFLKNKYNYLINENLYINSISKHQKNGIYKSILETSCASGTNFFRKNSFHNEIAFIKNWFGVTVFLDKFIDEKYLNYKSDFNVALIIESKAIKSNIYKRIFDLEKEFDLILTHDSEILINFEHKARMIPADTISTGPQFYGINKNKKTKDISFNFSSKKTTPGHKLRHVIANEKDIKTNILIDQLGSGPQNKRIIEKGEMINPYKFSISIENSIYNHYFTEKILDCFISGTVPIYWGCPTIGNFFDSNGILKFDNLKELKEHINIISKNPLKLYESMYQSIERNYLIAKEFLYYDDIYFLEILEFIDNKYGLENRLDWFKIKGNEKYSKINSPSKINNLIDKFKSKFI